MKLYPEETKFAEDLLMDFLQEINKIDDEASHGRWQRKVNDYIDKKLDN